MKKQILQCIAIIITAIPAVLGYLWMYDTLAAQAVYTAGPVGKFFLYYMAIALPLIMAFGYVYVPLTCGMGIPLRPFATLVKLTSVSYWNNVYIFLLVFSCFTAIMGIVAVPMYVSDEEIGWIKAIIEYVGGAYAIAAYLISVSTIGYLIDKYLPITQETEPFTFKVLGW